MPKLKTTNLNCDGNSRKKTRGRYGSTVENGKRQRKNLNVATLLFTNFKQASMHFKLKVDW